MTKKVREKKKVSLKRIGLVLLKISGWLGALLLMALIVVIVLYWQTDIVANSAERYLNRMLADKGKISYHSLKGNLVSEIQIDSLLVELNDGLSVSLDRLEVEYRLLPLLSGKVEVDRLFSERIVVALDLPERTGDTETGPAFDLDSLLAVIQNSNFIDSVLSKTPEMQLRDVALYAGEISIPDLPVTIKDVEMELGLVKVSPKQFRVKLDKTRALWQEKNLPLKELNFELSGNRQNLTLNQLNLRSDHSRLQLSAYYNLVDSIDINVNMYDIHVDFSDLQRITGNERLNNGFAGGNISLSGAPLDFSFQVDLSGRWKEQLLDQLLVDVAYKNSKFKIRKLRAETNGAEVDLQATVNKLETADGKLSFSALDLSRFDSTLPPTRLNGSLNFSIPALNLKRPSGVGAFELHQSHIDSIPIDSVLIAVQADRGSYRIKQPSFIKITPQNRFLFEGRVDRQKQMDMSVSTFDNSLYTLGQLFMPDSLQGKLDGHFRLSGHLFNPNLSGNLWLPRFQFQDIVLDSISLNVFTQKIFSSRQGETMFQVQSGKIGEIPVENMHVKARIDSHRVHIDDINFLSEENSLDARMEISIDRDEVTLVIPELRVEYESYWLENDDDLIAVIDSAEISLEAFRLNGPQQSAIEVAGFWDNSEQDLQAYVNLEKIELEPFEQFWDKQFKLSGKINGIAELINPLRDPNLEIDLGLSDLIYNGISLGNLKGECQYASETFYVQELELLNGESEFMARGDLAFSFQDKQVDFLEGTEADFKMNWKNFELENYAPLLKNGRNLKGLVSGYLEVGGTVYRPSLRHHLQLDNFEYDQFEVDSLNLFAQYSGGYFLIDSLAGIVNGTQFDARGWQKYDLVLSEIDTNFTDKPFQLNIHSKDDRIDVIGEFNEQLESIDGNYELDLNIVGTLEKPAIRSGFIRLEDGEILLSRVKEPIHDVQFEAGIENSVLTIDKFEGFSIKEKDLWEKGWRWLNAILPWSKRKIREGYVGAKGTIGLDNVLRPRFNLDVALDELYIDYFVENTALLLSSESIKISGRDTLFISGEVFVPQGTYEVDLAQMERNVYLVSSVVEETPPYLTMSLNIQIPGNFVITSSPLDLTNNFKIVILGDLETILEAGVDETQISGHLEVVSGKYSSWNQNFEVQSGSIDFKNPKTINPDIEIVADKRIGARSFELSITGNLEKLNQNIRVLENGRELDLSYLDKITMLTLGADLTQFTTSTDSTIRTVGEDVATTSVLTAVERGAEKFTGLDKVDISSNESIVDLQKGRLNNGLRDASISFGKYLTTDLYIEYRTQFGENIPAPKLSWQAGNRIGLQYRVNRNWSLDSFYEKTNRGNNKIQLGLNWEYTF